MKQNSLDCAFLGTLWLMGVGLYIQFPSWSTVPVTLGLLALSGGIMYLKPFQPEVQRDSTAVDRLQDQLADIRADVKYFKEKSGWQRAMSVRQGKTG